MDVAEIDQLIDDVQHSTLSRVENLALFRQQFERVSDAEYCEDCAVAVLDVVAPLSTLDQRESSSTLWLASST